MEKVPAVEVTFEYNRNGSWKKRSTGYATDENREEWAQEWAEDAKADPACRNVKIRRTMINQD